MVFSSLNFIFIFLPLFLFAYYVTPAAFRNSTLFAGSILFYAAGVIKQPYALFLLMVLTYLNYVFGICLYQIHNPRKKKLFLTKVIFFDFLWLFLFKYSRHLSLPLGISFYTFQLTAYLFDIYYGRILPERDFVTFGTYISMFPKLISGPITPYEMLRRQLHSARRFLPENLAEGMKLFIRGLGLKAILANQFGSLWANVGTIGYESISTPLAWLGIYAYSFQIYFDFYGYSLMAAGLGRMLGFKLPINFMHPYLSTSMTEFWRRWHITLSGWFRDYIYIPLGGNRKGQVRTYINLLIVFFATGLWHGAGATFIIWGLYHGLFLVVERMGLGKLLEKNCFRGLNHIYTALVVVVGWVFFRADTLADAKVILHQMFTWENGIYPASLFVNRKVIFLAVLGVLLSGIVQSICPKLREHLYEKEVTKTVDIVIMAVLLFLCTMYLVSSTYNPFIYFRF